MLIMKAADDNMYVLLSFVIVFCLDYPMSLIFLIGCVLTFKCLVSK